MVGRTRVMHGAKALLLTYGPFQPACAGVRYPYTHTVGAHTYSLKLPIKQLHFRT